ncbi:MAG: rhomboid family intramembrane serine protease [Haloarculaceae archaeon]
MSTVPAWAWQLALLVGLVASIGVLLALARPGGRWGQRVRTHLVLGLPLGTVLTVLFVLGVYLFVQNGLHHWYRPTQIPYRAWSYAYPLGMIVAPFAHGGSAHITGNLLGTVTFGVLAEYAWSHFPTQRGESTFGSLRTNPFARAVAFFVGALAVGLLTSFFSLGPVIGFSGVVFAFVGLALVRYPLATVGVVVGGDVVSLVYHAATNPETTARASSRFVTPWFAGVAIQGHYLGLLLGVVAGIALVRRRGASPAPARLWFATLVFGTSQALWALYVPQTTSTYVLFRALGAVVLLLLAALVTAAACTGDRTLVPQIDLARREAAVGLVVALLVATAVVSLPLNLLTVGRADVGAQETVHVRDYTVYYAEGVPNQLVPAVNVSVAGESTQVNASGVIVASERRSIWWPEVPASRLASRGHATIYLGGPGWRTPVRATRPGWRLLGGETTYKVYLQAGDRERELSFASPPATLDGQLAGKNVSIAPTETGFDLVVSRANRTVGRAPIPQNGTTEVGGLRFNRTKRELTVIDNGTRLPIAARATGED